MPKQNGQPAPNPHLDAILNGLYFSVATGGGARINSRGVAELVAYIEQLERVAIAAAMSIPPEPEPALGNDAA